MKGREESRTPLLGGAAKTPDPDKIRTLSKVLLVAFLLVGLALFYWSVVRAPAILARDDNPRLVEAALRVQRGALLDRNGVVLAENSGPAEAQERRYPAATGGHGVGFSDLRYGTAGAEAAFNQELSGATTGFWSALWHEKQHEAAVGEDVRLALDAEMQETAAALLGGQTGAALLLELPHEGRGEARVRVLASAPGYDATMLGEEFEALAADEDAPLLNRVTQGQYQPGLLVQPLIMATAVDQGLLRLDDAVEEPDRPVQVNGTTLRCSERPPERATWADVLRLRCPAPLRELADQMGGGGLEASFAAFGLDRDPVFELDVATSPEEALSDPLLAGIGQENLSVTPLQVGLALGALGNDGVLPYPQIGEAILTAEGKERPWHLDASASRAVSAQAARAVRRALPDSEGIAEFSPLVLSGPAGRANSWYTGMWSGATAEYVAVVVLENSGDEGAAQTIGRTLLGAVQEP